MKEMKRIKEAEDIYDYQWYPQMSSSDPNTAMFITTARDQPIHLYNANTCSVRHFPPPFICDDDV
jgi:telomerase Cajal body protein 1